ncbi:MAG: resuscitation-promoting factor RpfB [Nocardioidaceae bacterium]|nr:resuscitation-promoting factor RpfB [Nocardioidaceae bacterium]
MPQDSTPRKTSAAKTSTHSHSGPRRPRSRKKFSLIALNLAIVLIVAGGTAAYGALSKTVVLSIDGKQDTIRTFGDNVSDVLKAKHITIRDGDHLSPAPSSKLSDGAHVNVAYAKPLTLAVDGKVTNTTVYDRTVGQALDAAGVSPPTGAYVSAKRSAPLSRDGSQIVVSSNKSLTVIADGKKKKVTTKAPTVAGVLKAVDVKLDSDDEVDPGKAAFVSPDQKLRVVRIKKVTKTETVSVKFPVTYKTDSAAYQGETSVIKAGKPGKSREKVTIVYADGKVRDRIVLVSRSLSEPRPQIVSRGTKKAESTGNTVWDRIAKCESGGNWHINTGNGYYGGLQFSAATWHSVGGTGLPSDHTREEQIKRAKILQARSGWGQWSCAGARFN